MDMIRTPRLLLLGLVVVLTGCAQQVRYPLNAFHQYDYAEAVKGYRATLAHTTKEDERNVVLANIHLAGASFVGGNYYDTLTGLSEASKIMEDVEHGAERGQMAMALSHDMRVYKGEPYERALAYVYMGVIYYRRGDFDNARSAFNSALLADAGSKGDHPEYREDFGLAHYLIGKTFLRLGEADNAEISFNKVKKYAAGNEFADLDKQKTSNFTLLVELGCGPGKKPDPIVGSVDTIHECVYPERAAEIFVDGSSLGRASKVVDVNYQAKTSGSSTRDTVQAAKGVAIAVLKQVPFLGILGSIAEMGGVNRADLRHWRQMPGEVHVLEASVPEGLHTVQIKFFDAAGKELERFQQVHYFVRVVKASEGGAKSENLFVVRSGTDRHNEARTNTADYFSWGAAGPVIVQQRGFGTGLGPDVGLPLAAAGAAK
jgi:tetratricopeptide (TPR) repeat protein